MEVIELIIVSLIKPENAEQNILYPVNERRRRNTINANVSVQAKINVIKLPTATHPS